MEFLNAFKELPPIVKALLPVAAILGIGTGAGFLASNDILAKAKERIADWGYAISGGLTVGLITFFVIKRLF